MYELFGGKFLLNGKDTPLRSLWYIGALLYLSLEYTARTHVFGVCWIFLLFSDNGGDGGGDGG